MDKKLQLMLKAFNSINSHYTEGDLDWAKDNNPEIYNDISIILKKLSLEMDYEVLHSQLVKVWKLTRKIAKERKVEKVEEAFKGERIS